MRNAVVPAESQSIIYSTVVQKMLRGMKNLLIVDYCLATFRPEFTRTNRAFLTIEKYS